MRRVVICLLVFLGVASFTSSESEASYVSYFYTSGDAIVFCPQGGTNVSLKTSAGSVVWSFATISAGEIYTKTGLSAGNYSITSTKRVSLLVGDVVSGSASDCRGYYALDADGKPCGTEFYTYLRNMTEEDEPVLIVFSHQDNNTVTIKKREEFGYFQEWQGVLNKGAHQEYQRNHNQEIFVSSDYPVSVLVTGKRFYDDPASHLIPSTTGGFYGQKFCTYASGGTLYFFSYNDGTHIDLYDTTTGYKWASWDLDEYEQSSRAIPWTDLNFYYTIQSTKPITACRLFSVPNNQGMHYIADRSGTLIGTEFVFDAIPPIQVIAYEDGTNVDHHRSPGVVDTYTLNSGGYVTISANTYGRISSDKAVSVVSIGTVGATFVPIPTQALDTVPGPPAVFAVQHFPPQPTTTTSYVMVRWATDEPSTSCMTHRRNGGLWMSQQCDQTYKTQHQMYMDISGYSGNDKIDYYVWSTDKDNYTTVNNNNGNYYSFKINPFVPNLSVSRLSVYLNTDGDAYTVNFEIENTGTAKAEDIQIRERVSGLLTPTDNCTITPINDHQCDITIPVPDIDPGGRVYVSYDLVPILYANYATYGIGMSTASTISYESSGGTQYSSSFSAPETLSSSGVLGVIKQKDYVIATNFSRLRNRYNAVTTGQVLYEAARFSIEREGVVTCLETADRYQIEKLIDSNWNGRLNALGWANGWEYLLFIGKTDIVPSWLIVHKCTSIDPREAPVADNLYADIKEGDTYRPELIVGRLIGNDANDLIEQMQNALTPIDTDKAVLISGTGDGQDEFVDNIDSLDDFLGEYSTITIRHWKDIPTEAARTATFMGDAPNTDLFIYRDHADTWSWGYDDSPIHTGNVTSANFDGKHPIVWSIACWSGNIREYCLGDAFLDAGASVFIGATNPSPREPNNKFAKRLAVYHNTDWFGRSIGETFKNAKWKLIKDNIDDFTTCYSDARFKQVVNMYNLYGDPKRGLSTKSAIGSQPIQAMEMAYEYGRPPETIEILIPKYQVKSIAEVDYVTIPDGEGGATLSEENEPIVPIYVHKEYIEAGFKIQDVVMTGRSGPVTDSGLHLPIASFEDDDAQKTRPLANGEGFFPNKEIIFSWRVFEEPNGNQELVLTIFPFYYNPATTECEFYPRYDFEISYSESSVEIDGITVSQEEYPLGATAEATVHVSNNSGGVLAIEMETEILDELEHPVDVLPVIGPTIEPGDTAIPVAWVSDGRPPGYYYFKVTLRQEGRLLDTETKRFRLGIYSAATAGLQLFPSPEEGFEIGMPVEILAAFDNRCAHPLNGISTISIFHIPTSETVAELVRPLELAPDQVVEINEIWETVGMSEGTYRVSAFFAYDGQTTEPLSLDISTRKDIGIFVETEKERYELGEKVVAWVHFSDPDGGPLSNVGSFCQLRRPDLGVVPVELAYYPTLDLHVGWFLLSHDWQKGVYKIEVFAEKPGYRFTTAVKNVFVGVDPVDPCEGDFEPSDGDVDGSDLAIFAADFGRTNCEQGEPCEGDFDHDGDVDGSDLAVFAADFGRTDCPE